MEELLLFVPGGASLQNALRPELDAPNFDSGGDETQMASPAGTLYTLHSQQVNFLSSSPEVKSKRSLGEGM